MNYGRMDDQRAMDRAQEHHDNEVPEDEEEATPAECERCPYQGTRKCTECPV